MAIYYPMVYIIILSRLAGLLDTQTKYFFLLDRTS